MTLKTPERLRAILDTLASGNVVYSDAAIACGVRPNSFWHWVRSSQLDRDPDLWVNFIGERMPFFRAVEAARQIALCDQRARIEKRTMQYQGEPVFFRDIPEFEPVADMPPATIPHAPEVPRVTVAEVSEKYPPMTTTSPEAPREPDDIDLDDLLGPEPVAAEPVAVIPDARVTPHVAEPAPGRPMSALQKDLLARLAVLRAKNVSQTDEATGSTKGPS